MNTHTLLCIKQISNKDLLHKGSTHVGKESAKGWIHIHV